MKSKPLDGVTVVTFESRLAERTVSLIAKHGGAALSAPSMQEVPVDRHDAVFAFGERLMAGQVDALVLLTGVGTTMLVDTLSSVHSPEAIVDRLRRTVLVTRGPKPVRALKALGLSADVKVPEPNTWRELLATVDGADVLQPLTGKRLAVQEYGETNEELISELRSRGAQVESVSIYRWELPDDLEPLRAGIRSLVEGRAQVAVFTSRTQIDHVMRMANEDGLAERLSIGLKKVYVASIGPICSEGLRSYGIEPDLEPEHPKLGVLIRDLASSYGKWIPA